MYTESFEMAYELRIYHIEYSQVGMISTLAPAI